MGQGKGKESRSSGRKWAVCGWIRGRGGEKRARGFCSDHWSGHHGSGQQTPLLLGGKESPRSPAQGPQRSPPVWNKQIRHPAGADWQSDRCSAALSPQSGGNSCRSTRHGDTQLFGATHNSVLTPFAHLALPLTCRHRRPTTLLSAPPSAQGLARERRDLCHFRPTLAYRAPPWAHLRIGPPLGESAPSHLLRIANGHPMQSHPWDRPSRPPKQEPRSKTGPHRSPPNCVTRHHHSLFLAPCSHCAPLHSPSQRWGRRPLAQGDFSRSPSFTIPPIPYPRRIA